MKRIIIHGLEDLPRAAREFASLLQPGRVYALYGGMGAGKTTLIGEVCGLLEVDDDVSSPTFSIVNEYDSSMGKIYHADCYRLESEVEAMDVGMEDYFYSGGICFVEWPERIEGLLPEDVVNVKINVLPDGSREVEIYDL